MGNLGQCIIYRMSITSTSDKIHEMLYLMLYNNHVGNMVDMSMYQPFNFPECRKYVTKNNIIATNFSLQI